MMIFSRYKKYALIILRTGLFTACAPLPPANPKLSATLHEEAIRATAIKNYSVAIAKYEEAIRYNPLEAQLYLKQAEVLETLQQFDKAVKTYQLALDRLPEIQEERELIHYRLGLLRARDKSDHRRAKENLTFIKDESMRLDLDGCIHLYSGDPDEALRLFSRALQSALDSEQQARVYYHASQAHYAKNDLVESRNALFYAVNNARGLALKQHIRIFFEQLQQVR